MEKRQFMTIIALMAITLVAWSQSISESKAIQIASQVLGTPAQTLNPQQSAAALPCRVVEKEQGGFVLIGGTDQEPRVIGYSDNGSIDLDNLPPQLEAILDELDGSQYGQWQMPRASRSDEEVVLATANWNQGYPYNALCPKMTTESGESKQCVTGCVATAMAIVMKYHEWPKQGIGSHSYEWKGQTLSFDFENTEFDWDNMPNGIPANGYTDEQVKALSTLMYACGVSVDMSYSPYGSGAHNSDYPFYKYFDYAYECGQVYKYNIQDEWADLIHENIDNDCPLLLSGSSGSSAHAFVCDGYSGDYLHINWGWGGLSNGFFHIDALGSFPSSNAAIFDLYPATERVECAETTIIADSYGIQLNVTEVVPGEEFKANAQLNFEEKLSGMALVDAEGTIKEIIASSNTYERTYDCLATCEVEDDDYIQAVARADENSPWLPIRGNRFVPTKAKAKGYELMLADVTLDYDPEEVEVSLPKQPIMYFTYTVDAVSKNGAEVGILLNGETYSSSYSSHAGKASLNFQIYSKNYHVAIGVCDSTKIITDAEYHVEQPGTLSTLVEGHDNLRITSLTLTGTLNSYDCAYIRSNMPLLESIDMEYARFVGLTEDDANDAVPYKAFHKLKSLNEIILPLCTKIIEKNAFFDTTIDHIVLPNGLESIEGFTFYNYLTALDIPISVTNIGEYLYQGSSLRDIYVHWGDPEMTSVVSNTLPQYYFDYDLCTLHVPEGTADLYASAFFWERFTNIVEDANSQSGIGSVVMEADGCAPIYNMQGIPQQGSIEDLAPGYYIINHKVVLVK